MSGVEHIPHPDGRTYVQDRETKEVYSHYPTPGGSMNNEITVPLTVPIPYREPVLVGHATVDQEKLRDALKQANKRDVPPGSELREVTVLSAAYQLPKPAPDKIGFYVYSRPGVVFMFKLGGDHNWYQWLGGGSVFRSWEQVKAMINDDLDNLKYVG